MKQWEEACVTRFVSHRSHRAQANGSSCRYAMLESAREAEDWKNFDLQVLVLFHLIDTALVVLRAVKILCLTVKTLCFTARC